MTDTADGAHRSARRDQSVRATRRAIVAAATELFVERGYAATTIDAVADRAGVGRKTVFDRVGGKGPLLKLAWDWALAGDDAPVPMSERPAVRAIQAEPDPARMVALWVAMTVDVGSRVLPLGRVVLAAADADAEAAGLARTVQQESLAGARAFAAELSSRGGLRPDVTVEQVAELCWAVINSLLLSLLVGQAGWSRDRYAAWLTRMLAAALLVEPGPPPATVASGPTVDTRPDEAGRGYDATVGDRPAGRLDHDRGATSLTVLRVAVEPAYDGRGVPEALMAAAVADARAAGLTPVAADPYAAWWLARGSAG